MELGQTRRPRVSRETRLLLTTAVVAVATLWGLARVRFPDRPAPPNPVAPILTQLAARPALDDLAGEIAALHPRLEPLFVMLPGAPHPALRIRGDVAAVLVDPPALMSAGIREHIVALDPASRLALVRVQPVELRSLAVWTPEDSRRPRYLVATDASTSTFALRPVFVGSLDPLASPVWPEEVWLLPGPADLAPGAFVFTTDARLAGLVVAHGDRRAIVPAAVLLAEVDRLVLPRATTAGYVGIDVQPLTPPLSRATRSAAGVVVTWVDPTGPAARLVGPGDVLEAANEQPLPTPLHWDARAARLTSGEQLVLRVRRSGEPEEIAIAAVPLRARPAVAALGLTLTARPGTGSVVTRVADGSAAARAGLTAGDVITRIAGVTVPAPAAVRRAFAAAASGEPVLVAVTRGDAHHVTALEK